MWKPGRFRAPAGCRELRYQGRCGGSRSLEGFTTSGWIHQPTRGGFTGRPTRVSSREPPPLPGKPVRFPLLSALIALMLQFRPTPPFYDPSRALEL